MERKVVIASAKSNAAARTQFSGSTFGELKNDPIFSSIYGNGEGVDAIVKPGNVTLRDDSSVLPEGDFSVFLVTTKNKAGLIDIDIDLDDEVENIEEVVEQFAQQKVNQIVTEVKSAIAAVVAKYKAEATAAPSTGDDELDNALSEAHNI